MGGRWRPGVKCHVLFHRKWGRGTVVHRSEGPEQTTGRKPCNDSVVERKKGNEVECSKEGVKEAGYIPFKRLGGDRSTDVLQDKRGELAECGKSKMGGAVII